MVLEEIVQPLVKWYRDNKRILPWRDKDNAYYTWVSEIMLQQTRVEAVKPYFQRFITELPDIQSLAECPEEKLLKLWEGLGYYNRVRNMQEAAKTVKDEYNGRLPEDYRALLSLKNRKLYSRCHCIDRIWEKGSGCRRECTACDFQNYREYGRHQPAVCPQKNRTAGFADHALRLSGRL